MHLPKINGQINSDEVADMIVTHIFAKTSTYRIDNQTKKELEAYIKEIIESVKKEGKL